MRALRRLRIGIDLHVVDGKFQGSRTHSIELFGGVVTACPDIDFYVFLDQPDELSSLSAPFGSQNVTRVRMPQSNPVKRLLWQLPMLERRYGLDLLHTQYVLPWNMTCKGVVTIHDVLFETHARYFEKAFVLRSRILMRSAARRASHVLTVSDFSRGELARIYGVPPDRISVVKNAANLTRFAPGLADHSLLSNRGISSGNYILSVGRLEPRKNHEGLVEAYARLVGRVPHLVLVGQRDFKCSGVLEAIRRNGLGHRVSVLEDVSDAELPVLYSNALFFAYPAFAEGFGMPPLEALACGIPVIASNTTAIPEVVGDAGLLVDPTDIEALRSGMQSLIDDEVLRRKLSSVSRSRAERFRWDVSARRLGDVYRTLGHQIAERPR